MTFTRTYFRIALVLVLPVVLSLSCGKSPSSNSSLTTTTKSSVKKVLSITFSQLNPPVSATVDGSGYWHATVPIGTDKAHLVTTVVCSDNATTIPASGTAWDFTVNSNGVTTFIVTAEDGSTITYYIQVQ